MTAFRIRLIVAAALLASMTGATVGYGPTLARQSPSAEGTQAAEPDTYAGGDLIVSGTLVTMDEKLSVERNARVYIRKGRIAAILSADAPLPPEAEGVPQLRTQGFIYPGLINAHNHLVYNVLPSWELPIVNERPFVTRDEWREGLGEYQQARESYSQNVTWPKSDLLDAGVAAEVGKWAEMKELVAGTTSTQGSFSFHGRLSSSEESAGFKHHLVRNIDLDGMGKTRQSSVGIYNFRYPHGLNETLLEDILTAIQKGRIDAFLVHLSEGTSVESRDELYDLNRFHLKDGQRCGPLLEKTVVIHGTPYRREEFELMAECGADLVAAPLSNLLYYGSAPNLADAVASGVRVSLSTDWNPVGSKNLLVELKVADFLNKHFYQTRLSDAELVRMVTSNPAQSIGWGDRAGRLEPGLFGDLLVIDSLQTDPYRALIEATERDVALVVVGGEPLYGDVEVMRVLKPADHEVVETGCGFQKAIDVTTARPGVESGRQDFQTILRALREGFQTLQPGIRGKGISPLYMCQDSSGLEAIGESANLDYYEPEMGELTSTLARYYTPEAMSQTGSEPSKIASAAVASRSDQGVAGEAAPETQSVTAVVQRVLDGDTLWVQYADGSTDTVRVRGIDAPEIFSRNQPSRFQEVKSAACLDRWGKTAAQYAIDTLSGQTVSLVMDSRKSSFGQTLAYVQLNGEDFNAGMVTLGYARVFTGATGGPRVERYLDLQERARAQRTGLWAC